MWRKVLSALFCVHKITNTCRNDRHGERVCDPSQRAWPILLPCLQVMNGYVIIGIRARDLLILE